MSSTSKTGNPPAKTDKTGKTAWFDCSFGVSGDMCLGALVDAGAPFKPIKELPEALGLIGVTISKRSVKRAGLRACKVSVKVDQRAQKARRLRDVERIIRKASVSYGVKGKSLDLFRRIFEAEARVHGGKAADVHLHEIGAADTLVDIVGTVLCLEMLGVDRVFSSPVGVGSGTVKCAHGLLPVPAPATAELLKGVPVCSGVPQAMGGVELATPTGAAIITGLAEGFGPIPDMVVSAVGSGAGATEIEARPNALRVFLGQSGLMPPGARGERVMVIEANIDDMTPEALAYAAETILEAGALDVFITPVVMKKGRPGHLLTVLSDSNALEDLCRKTLAETMSIGVRVHESARTVLERKIRKVKTRYGAIRVKDAFLDGKLLRSAPEYEDCKKAARKYKKPITLVMLEAEKAAGD